eukprot:SAG31_NODE_1779_length_7293_cov_39.850153_1_plen_69_part_00
MRALAYSQGSCCDDHGNGGLLQVPATVEADKDEASAPTGVCALLRTGVAKRADPAQVISYFLVFVPTM